MSTRLGRMNHNHCHFHLYERETRREGEAGSLITLLLVSARMRTSNSPRQVLEAWWPYFCMYWVLQLDLMLHPYQFPYLVCGMILVLLLHLSRSQETLPISAVEGPGPSYVICGTDCKLQRLDSRLRIMKGNFKRGTTEQSVGQGPLLASRAARVRDNSPSACFTEIGFTSEDLCFATACQLESARTKPRFRVQLPTGYFPSAPCLLTPSAEQQCCVFSPKQDRSDSQGQWDYGK